MLFETDPRVWSHLRRDLGELKQQKLARSLEVISGRKNSCLRIKRQTIINFSSNDYLGLTQHPAVVYHAAAALRIWGTGSGASRLVSGNLRIHAQLEEKLASFKKEEAALLFSSGYLANLGIVTALFNEKDVILLDRLNHASLIDAARLSRAKLWVYPHRDLAALSKLLDRTKTFRRRLVMTDAYFSMDGDVAALDKLLELCRTKETLLMVDEAHSTGVFGKQGRGLTEHFGLTGQVDIVMGTLSKSLGSVGGFAVGKRLLKDYLVNRSREFIYTTAPSPAASAAALAALEVIQKRPKIRKRLWDNVVFLRQKLERLGYDLMGSEGPIIPVLIKDVGKGLALRDFLRQEGAYAPVIRPPTVPKDTTRLRLSVTAAHTKAELDQLVELLKRARNKIL